MPRHATARARPRLCGGHVGSARSTSFPTATTADRRLPRLGCGHIEGMAVSETLKKAAHAVGAHRIPTRPFTGHVRVERDGRVLAASDRAMALDETGLPTRFYLPRDDVRMDLLAPSETTSHCPFKGDATYFSAPGAKDAFWVYESPSEDDALPIAGMLAPWPGRVDVIVDRTPI
jgi:uncharacterized protein (DUF427 family)